MSGSNRRTALWKFKRGEEALQVRLELDEQEPVEKTMLEFFDCGDLYEADVSNVMLRVLEPGDTVIDVGANCGYFTALAAVLVGQQGKVLAYEPAAERVSRLKATVAANSLGNVVIVEKIVTDRPGEADFHLSSDGAGGHALWDPGRWPSNARSRANPLTVRVPATSIDHECQSRRLAVPKVIKVDTEGAEQLVLEGSRSLLSQCKVPFVVAEWHAFGLSQLGYSQESLRALMEGLGYSTFGLYLDGSLPKLVPPATRIESPFILNFLFSTAAWVSAYWPAATIDPRRSQ